MCGQVKVVTKVESEEELLFLQVSAIYFKCTIGDVGFFIVTKLVRSQCSSRGRFG